MKIIKNLATIFISIIIILSIIELLLRFTGSKPRKSDLTNNNEPKIYIEDVDLGWIQKPGRYIFQPWSEEGKKTIFTVNNDGSRSVYYESNSDKKIVFIGGSATQGWAVDDKDNYASIFQMMNPEYKVMNYGVGGYGGHQSLLMQERIINNVNSISRILYGFIDHHELRNVGAGSWMYLLNKFSSRGHTLVPYASLNSDKKLMRNPPLKYIKIPYSEISSLLAKIEKRIMKIKSMNRENQKFLISKKIISEMNKNSKKINASFSVIFLDIDQSKLNQYKIFFRKNNIDYIYCPFPDGDKVKVKGEGHPNRNGHQIVAKCLYNNF